MFLEACFGPPRTGSVSASGVLWLGEAGVGKLLVVSQVVLSFQLPFAMWPLIRLTSDRILMGNRANGPWVGSVSWALFAVISAANVWLLTSVTG